MDNLQDVQNDIDASLADMPVRHITAAVLRRVLKRCVQYVTDLTQNKLSAWFQEGTGSPSLNSTDSIYRDGPIGIRGGMTARTRTGTNAEMRLVNIGDVSAIQIMGLNGGPAFMEFHLPGLLIHQLGVDTDGRLKLHPWGTSVSQEVIIDRISKALVLTEELSNRKIVVYGADAGDHQFFGLGINSNVLRFQVGGHGSDFVFYSGSGPTSSVEVFRIKGDGRVGIGIDPAGNTSLDLAGGWASFHGNIAGLKPGNGIGVSIGWNYSGGQAESSIVFGYQDWPGAYLNFVSFNGVTMTERMRINAGNGFVGIGTSVPSSQLHVTGIGYQQFRIENGYTPSGPNDPNGAAGQICWDNNFMYVKTNAGWRRSALNAW